MWPNQQKPQPPTEEQLLQKRKRKRLFKIVLSMVGFLIILILVLNFFVIPKLTETLPNYLDWVPYRQTLSKLPFFPSQPTPTGTAVQSTQIIGLKEAASQSSQQSQSASEEEQIFTPNSPQNDLELAKNTIDKYIRDNIQKSFLPKTLIIRQGLTIDNRLENVESQFGSNFGQGETSFSITYHNREGTNTPNDFIILIRPSNIKKGTVITQKLAEELTSTYFINPYSPIENCNTKDETSFCEAFKTEENGKRGYGAVYSLEQASVPPQPTIFVFTCFIPNESTFYDEFQSCISP
jgi:hypothetical protein